MRPTSNIFLLSHIGIYIYVHMIIPDYSLPRVMLHVFLTKPYLAIAFPCMYPYMYMYSCGQKIFNTKINVHSTIDLVKNNLNPKKIYKKQHKKCSDSQKIVFINNFKNWS